MGALASFGRQPAAPLPASWGDLDDAPSPRQPDPVVFGWYPVTPLRPCAMRACRGCGCAQADVPALALPCWNCGARPQGPE
jgi:hypothetical protein